MRSLPKEWQKKVLEESKEAKMAKHLFLVRITGIPPKHPGVLRHLIENALNLDISQVELVPNGP